MLRPAKDTTKKIQFVHLPEIDGPQMRKHMDANPLEYPVQFVCHIMEPESNQVKFIAFDSFNSHHFTLTENRFSEYQTFYGNNETHLQDYHKLIIQDPEVDHQTKHSP